VARSIFLQSPGIDAHGCGRGESWQPCSEFAPAQWNDPFSSFISVTKTHLEISEGTTQLGECTFSEKWQMRGLVSVLFPRYLMIYPSQIDKPKCYRDMEHVRTPTLVKKCEHVQKLI
jgi:hypothetical protein